MFGSDALRCLLILTVAAAIALTPSDLWTLVASALVFCPVDVTFLLAIGALPLRISPSASTAGVQGADRRRHLRAAKLSHITTPDGLT
ncbi:hypothetical protein [Streptomyces sp. NPDC097610]|uniref:hypothetical protein n=1 Tax=Streptomyces sp. NPDC097610 TaxID=3157227 RepID=UPI00332C7F35